VLRVTELINWNYQSLHGFRRNNITNMAIYCVTSKTLINYFKVCIFQRLKSSLGVPLEMKATYILTKTVKINQYMQHILRNLCHPPTLPLLFVSSCNQASPSISASPGSSSTSLRVIPSFWVKSSLTCFPHLDLSDTLWCLAFSLHV